MIQQSTGHVQMIQQSTGHVQMKQQSAGHASEIASILCISIVNDVQVTHACAYDGQSVT